MYLTCDEWYCIEWPSGPNPLLSMKRRGFPTNEIGHRPLQKEVLNSLSGKTPPFLITWREQFLSSSQLKKCPAERNVLIAYYICSQLFSKEVFQRGVRSIALRNSVPRMTSHYSLPTRPGLHVLMSPHQTFVPFLANTLF